MLLGFLWSLLTLRNVIVAAVFVLCNAATAYYALMPADLPPGPRNHPFLGVLLEWAKSEPIEKVREWRERFGDIFCFYLAAQPIVVLSNFRLLREVFSEQGAHLLGRPSLAFAASERPEGLVLAEGELWEKQRRFASSALKSFAIKKQTLTDKVLTEVELLRSELVGEGRHSTFAPLAKLRPLALNVLLSTLVGDRLDPKDPLFGDILGKLQMHPAAFTWSPLNFVPFLASVPRLDGRFRFIASQMESLRNSVSSLLDEERRVNGSRGIDSFVHYFRRCRSKDVGRFFTWSQLRASLLDVVTEGVGPLAETLGWALVLLAAHPHAQQKVCAHSPPNRDVAEQKVLKVAEELEDTLEGRKPKYEDRGTLPLTCASLLEVQRLAPVTPLTLPRVATKAVRLRSGRRIPAGAWVVGDLESCLLDEESFPSPWDFSPKRFLDPEAKLGAQPAFLPFSTGPRACLGAHTAKVALFVGFARLVQVFEFSFAANSETRRPISLAEDGALDLHLVLLCRQLGDPSPNQPRGGRCVGSSLSSPLPPTRRPVAQSASRRTVRWIFT